MCRVLRSVALLVVLKCQKLQYRALKEMGHYATKSLKTICLRPENLSGEPASPSGATREALRSRPRPRFLAGGVLEYRPYCTFSELRPRSGLEVLSGHLPATTCPRAKALDCNM
jgi:hypothetical protein